MTLNDVLDVLESYAVVGENQQRAMKKAGKGR